MRPSRLLDRLGQRILGISPQEASFERRGFPGRGSGTRPHLERAGTTFIDGYNLALAGGSRLLRSKLGAFCADHRGFAFEGAAMALALLDLLSARPYRLRRYLSRVADDHVYVAHVGAGWAVARLPIRRRGLLRRLDPLLRWLAFDGYGFHEAFFHWRRTIERQRVPRRLRGYERRAFDQGVGRSLWFVYGAEPGPIARALTGFPARRQEDLWSGVGLACAYAGGATAEAVESLRDASGAARPAVAQGAAFAAEARRRAGILNPQARRACRILCGVPVEQAADVARTARLGLPPDDGQPAYEHWRRRVRQRLVRESRC